jgi:uncharacterized protein (DUF983 family)
MPWNGGKNLAGGVPQVTVVNKCAAAAAEETGAVATTGWLARAWPAFRHGLRCRCPACGTGRLFQGYLTVPDACPDCARPMSIYRSDDAPPYFTVLIVGHVVLAGVLLLEVAAAPPMWLQMALWVPATLGLTLALLPRIKGAVIAVHWALDLVELRGEDPAP